MNLGSGYIWASVGLIYDIWRSEQEAFKYIFFNLSHASFCETTMSICSGHCFPVRSGDNFAACYFFRCFLEKRRDSHHGMIPLARKITTYLISDVVRWLRWYTNRRYIIPFYKWKHTSILVVNSVRRKWEGIPSLTVFHKGRKILLP